jgi:hypothetical protein
MYARRCTVRRLVPVGATLTLLLAFWSACTGVARADAPSASEWPVERNAQALGRREFKIGLWSFDGGITDWLEVGTLWAPWVLVSPNIHVKSRLLHRGPWSLAAEVTFLTLDFEHLDWFGYDDLSGRLYLLPATLAVDVEAHPRVLVGLSATYSAVHSTPRFDATDAGGTGAYDTLYASGHLTARASDRWWIVTELDWVLFQGLVAIGDLDTQTDDFTTVTGSASANVDAIAPGRGGDIAVSAVYRGGNFGLRFGVGYGNWVVPRLRLVVPKGIPFLLFDVFARFGGTTAPTTEPDADVSQLLSARRF